MKKIMTMLVALIAMIGMVNADPTIVDTTWSGGGNFQLHFYSGDDSESHFFTGGNVISGDFYGVDYNDNPWSYGVDTTSAYVDADVDGGGFIEFYTDRLDSAAKWGSPGQQSYSYIETDGWGSMEFQTTTKAAELQDCGNYKYNPNFAASGDEYVIIHTVTDFDGDGASVIAYSDPDSGTDSAEIRMGGAKAGMNNGFNFGRLPTCGDGCAWYGHYASFEGSGKGGFEVHAWADNGLNVESNCPGDCTTWSIPGDGSDDSATYDLYVGYTGDWSYPDFGVSGN